MQNIFSIFQNYILISALASWCIAQIAKVLTGMFHDKKINVVRLLLSSGGMPSSHSATVSALCTASGVEYGVNSFQFAVTCILAVIVMHDAAGVRKEVGEQARIINQMRENTCTWSFENIDLKELVGHTPLQVFIGALLGVLFALCMGLLYQKIII